MRDSMVIAMGSANEASEPGGMENFSEPQFCESPGALKPALIGLRRWGPVTLEPPDDRLDVPDKDKVSRCQSQWGPDKKV